MFAGHVVGTMTAEGSLHDACFAEFGLTRAQVEQTPLAPTTLAYTSYMLRVATLGDYAEVLGVVLPCYWIYQEVGRVLLAKGSPDAMYRCWIETYGGEEYAAVVDAVLTEVDRVGAGLTAAQKRAVQEVFVTASRYEWLFWEMGWRLEQWPI
jgi:thiaminase/transcriptional activator TenA